MIIKGIQISNNNLNIEYGIKAVNTNYYCDKAYGCNTITTGGTSYGTLNECKGNCQHIPSFYPFTGVIYNAADKGFSNDILTSMKATYVPDTSYADIKAMQDKDINFFVGFYSVPSEALDPLNWDSTITGGICSKEIINPGCLPPPFCTTPLMLTHGGYNQTGNGMLIFGGASISKDLITKFYTGLSDQTNFDSYYNCFFPPPGDGVEYYNWKTLLLDMRVNSEGNIVDPITDDSNLKDILIKGLENLTADNKEMVWGHNTCLYIDSTNWENYSGTTWPVTSIIVHNESNQPIKDFYSNYSNLVKASNGKNIIVPTLDPTQPVSTYLAKDSNFNINSGCVLSSVNNPCPLKGMIDYIDAFNTSNTLYTNKCNSKTYDIYSCNSNTFSCVKGNYGINYMTESDCNTGCTAKYDCNLCNKSPGDPLKCTPSLTGKYTNLESCKAGDCASPSTPDPMDLMFYYGNTSSGLTKAPLMGEVISFGANINNDGTLPSGIDTCNICNTPKGGNYQKRILCFGPNFGPASIKSFTSTIRSGGLPIGYDGICYNIESPIINLKSSITDRTNLSKGLIELLQETKNQKYETYISTDDNTAITDYTKILSPVGGNEILAHTDYLILQTFVTPTTKQYYIDHYNKGLNYIGLKNTKIILGKMAKSSSNLESLNIGTPACTKDGSNICFCGKGYNDASTNCATNSACADGKDSPCYQSNGGTGGTCYNINSPCSSSSGDFARQAYNTITSNSANILTGFATFSYTNGGSTNKCLH